MEYLKSGTNYIVRLDCGEEVCEKLSELALKEKIALASVQGLGACGELTVGCYRVSEKKYYADTFEKEMEITSLIGTITSKEDLPYLHLHINAADESHQVIGGHCNRCVITATCEIVVHVMEGKVSRKADESTGLNLFDFEIEKS